MEREWVTGRRPERNVNCDKGFGLRECEMIFFSTSLFIVLLPLFLSKVKWTDSYSFTSAFLLRFYLITKL